MKTRQLSTTSVDVLMFQFDIGCSVLPEFDAEVNPTDVS